MSQSKGAINEKIAVVTATFNDDRALRVTAESIACQSDKDFIWIIIDNNSTDGTRDVISDFKDKINILFVSEKDNGIYNALNKGIKLAAGSWVIFLGAGDYLFSPDSILQIKPELDQNYGFVYFNIVFNRGSKLKFEKQQACKIHKWSLSRPNVPHHQSLFTSPKVFEDFCFDESYKICADAKLYLEASKSFASKYVDNFVTAFQQGGVSTSQSTYLTLLTENQRICDELSLHPPSRIVKYISSLKIFIKKLLLAFRLTR